MNDWTKIIQDGGVFVSTKVSLYRARRKWDNEELGLRRIPSKLGSAGSINLLPPEICPQYERLKQIEGAVNNLVALHTFEMEGIGKFMKVENFSDFNNELIKLKQEFALIVNEFVTHYQEYIEASINMWRELADKFNMQPDEMEYKVREAFPPSFVIPDKFKLEVRYYKLPAPATDVWQDALEEQKQMAQEFVEATMRQLRSETADMMNQIQDAVTNGKWNQKTLNRVTKMLDRIKRMQLAEDRELTDSIEEFKQEYLSTPAKEYKNNEEMFRQLGEGIKGAVQKLNELADEDLNPDILKNTASNRALNI